MIDSFHDLDAIRDECRALVRRRALASGAVTAVPLPMVDAAADVTILLRMLPQISKAYGLTPEQIAALDPHRRAMVYGTMKQLGESFVGRAITRRMIAAALTRAGTAFRIKSSVRYAPVAGQVLAAGISYGMMRWLGYSHINDCHRVAQRTLELQMFGPGGGPVIDGVATRA